MGWTGDSQIFFNTASYLVDYAAFARKHVRDIYDRQWNSGRLPQIAPYAHEDWFMWVMNGSVGWACAGVYIPCISIGNTAMIGCCGRITTECSAMRIL